MRPQRDRMVACRRRTEPSNAGPPFTFRPFCAYVERPDMRTFLRFRQVVAGGCVMAATVAACTRSQAAGGGRVPVTVARAERRAVPYTIGALGTVEPISTVAVTSQVSGMLLRVRFHEGDEVAAGQVLFEIEPRPYRAALTPPQAPLAP